MVSKLSSVRWAAMEALVCTIGSKEALPFEVGSKGDFALFGTNQGKQVCVDARVLDYS